MQVLGRPPVPAPQHDGGLHTLVIDQDEKYGDFGSKMAEALSASSAVMLVKEDMTSARVDEVLDDFQQRGGTGSQGSIFIFSGEEKTPSAVPKRIKGRLGEHGVDFLGVVVPSLKAHGDLHLCVHNIRTASEQEEEPAKEEPAEAYELLHLQSGGHKFFVLTAIDAAPASRFSLALQLIFRGSATLPEMIGKIVGALWQIPNFNHCADGDRHSLEELPALSGARALKAAAEEEEQRDVKTVEVQWRASLHPRIERPYFGNDGLIGSGKTTSITRAQIRSAGHDEVRFTPEPVDEEWKLPLARFYTEGDADAFERIVWTHHAAIADAYRRQQQLTYTERTLESTILFCRVLRRQRRLSPQLFADLLRRFDGLWGERANRPLFVILYEMTPEVALERIQLRGRTCEQAIDLEYLGELDEEYLQLYPPWRKDVIRVKATEAQEDIMKEIVQKVQVLLDDLVRKRVVSSKTADMIKECFRRAID